MTNDSDPPVSEPTPKIQLFGFGRLQKVGDQFRSVSVMPPRVNAREESKFATIKCEKIRVSLLSELFINTMCVVCVYRWRAMQFRRAHERTTFRRKLRPPRVIHCIQRRVTAIQGRSSPRYQVQFTAKSSRFSPSRAAVHAVLLPLTA